MKNVFPTVSREPVEVEIGKHKAIATLTPMKAGAFIKLTKMDILTAKEIDPLIMTTIFADNVLKLQGIDEEITAEYLADNLYLPDILDLINQLMRISKFSDDQVKNSGSLSASQSSAAEVTKTAGSVKDSPNASQKVPNL